MRLNDRFFIFSRVCRGDRVKIESTRCSVSRVKVIVYMGTISRIVWTAFGSLLRLRHCTYEVVFGKGYTSIRSCHQFGPRGSSYRGIWMDKSGQCHNGWREEDVILWQSQWVWNTFFVSVGDHLVGHCTFDRWTGSHTIPVAILSVLFKACNFSITKVQTPIPYLFYLSTFNTWYINHIIGTQPPAKAKHAKIYPRMSVTAYHSHKKPSPQVMGCHPGSTFATITLTPVAKLLLFDTVTVARWFHSTWFMP